MLDLWLYFIREIDRTSHAAAYVLGSAGLALLFIAVVERPDVWPYLIVVALLLLAGAVGCVKLGDHLEEREVEETKRKLRHWRL